MFGLSEAHHLQMVFSLVQYITNYTHKKRKKERKNNVALICFWIFMLSAVLVLSCRDTENLCGAPHSSLIEYAAALLCLTITSYTKM